jgi:GNAT superfamily N-acetyltransferase
VTTASEQAALNVRLAERRDIPVVADMLDEATAYVRTKGSDQWRVPFPHEELRERAARNELYVVDVDGEPAATFTLLLEDRFFWGERPPDAVYLHKLAVRRAFAGRKLGERIVGWVVAEAAARGCDYVRLDCQRDLPGIRAYYERLGFELRGEKTKSPDRAWALYERRVRA